MKNIRNVAIIAHVDHGKTTLVDGMLRQGNVFRENERVEERMMDSNDLEKERGITIFSKNASFFYKDFKINIVDTPGHADFGGEVQRILKMVDSVLLVVDALEGPMPQTKYVLRKSLELGLKPIVVINKIDRPNARPDEVLNMVFDLFVELNANDNQLDFTVVYASAKNGFAKMDMRDPDVNMLPLFDTIIDVVDAPEGDEEKPFQFLATTIEYDNYIGKIGRGRIHNGKVSQGEQVVLLKRDGSKKNYKITKIYTFEGMKKKEVPQAFAGDIVALAGIDDIDVGETVADFVSPVQLPVIDIDEPTLSMTFIVNNSPFVGKEGKFITSRNIWDRLQKELQTNVSLKVEATDSTDSFIVKGRGELQMSILIENMRREGFELQVSKPSVIYKIEDGKKLEPIELAIIDVPSEFVGVVIEKMGSRKGEMINMVQGNDGYTRVEFKVPTRGLIGFRNELMNESKGTGIFNHSFYEYEYYKGEIPSRLRGVLVSWEQGTTVAYSLDSIQERGVLFIGAGVEVYEGMIIGENARDADLVVNACKGKKLTNMRTSSADEAVRLTPPREFSLEQALEYIEEDELVEVTPKSIRMRKKILSREERKRSERSSSEE